MVKKGSPMKTEKKGITGLHSLEGLEKKEYFTHLDDALEKALKCDLPIKDEIWKIRSLMGFLLETEYDLFNVVPIMSFQSGFPDLISVLSFVVNKCKVGEKIRKINLNLLEDDLKRQLEYRSTRRRFSERNLEETVREEADFNAELVCDKIKEDLLNFSENPDDASVRERIEEWKKIRKLVNYYAQIVESDVMIDTDADSFVKFEFGGQEINFSLLEVNTKLVDRKDRYVEVEAEMRGYDSGLGHFVKYILNLYFDKKAMSKYFAKGDVDKGPSQRLRNLLTGSGSRVGMRLLTAKGMFEKLSSEKSLEPKSVTTIVFGPFMDYYTGTLSQSSNLDRDTREKIWEYIKSVNRDAYLLEINKTTVERNLKSSPNILEGGLLSRREEIHTKEPVEESYYIPSDSMVDLVSEELKRLGIKGYKYYTYRGGHFVKE